MAPVRSLLLTAVAASFAACGGDDEPARSTASSTAAALATPSPTSSPPAEATATATPAPTAAASARPRVTVLARGLEVPWDIAFLPDRRALVTERPGRIRLLDASGRLQGRPVIRVPTRARGEGGLMGIAVDPEFAEGRRFVYVYVTTAGGVQVQRWQMGEDDSLTRDAVVLDGIEAGPIHDSGRLRFGPDGRLYVATGDAGNGALAQRIGSLNGRFLRLEPEQYRSRTNQPTIFSSGHRNPQGLDWQPRTGRLFATEHGPSGFDGPSGNDEVNLVRRGGNYGWPRARGRSQTGAARPAWLWERTVAPSGAAFVSAPGTAWTGDLLVAALKGRALHRLDVRGSRIARDYVLYRGRYGRLRAVVQAPDGSIWVTTSNRDTYGSPVSDEDDRVLRIAPPSR